MWVIAVPRRLKIAGSLLFLCVPLIALEVAIANRSPIWKLPLRNMGYWALAFALICIPLIIWLMGAKKWAHTLTTGLAGTWVLASAWVSVSIGYPPLGFFTLFLLAFFVVQLGWLKWELSKSFFDPQISWYQALPRPIPGLSCMIHSGEKELTLRVARMDQDGVFLFCPPEYEKAIQVLNASLERKRKFEMTFQTRERRIVCEGVPILSIENGKGLGVQFLNISPDLKKEVGDFVEILRGQGYVE